jgi:hypothetical protein
MELNTFPNRQHYQSQVQMKPTNATYLEIPGLATKLSSSSAGKGLLDLSNHRTK